MKTVFLQITGRSLTLTPVRKAGRQNLYGLPGTFELPENLGAGKALSNLHALAVFTANCIRETGFAGQPFVFCLGSRDMVTKEYRHLPAREADLKKLARLETETVLPEGTADDYAIAAQEYHRADPATGRLKSILFAVPKSLVTGIRQEFRQAGIRVVKIVPVLNGLMRSCQTALGLFPNGAPYRGKTVAVIDAGRESLRVILFHSGEVLFQKEFDSVWDDILDLLCREGSMSRAEAAREMLRPGFLLTGGRSSFGTSVTVTVRALLETAAAEVMRNIRVVLSSERLEADRILFCGAVASHPDFGRYVETVLPEIPSETAKASFGLEQQAAVAGFHAEDFFALDGLLAKRTADTVDFMAVEHERLGNRRLNITVMAVLTAAAVGVMAVQPILLRAAEGRQKADQSMLSSPQAAEIKGMVEKRDKLQSQINALENGRNLLPYRKSKASEILSKLETQLIPRITSLTSCQIDGATGVVTLNFTTATLSQLDQARAGVAAAGYFTVLTPFSAAKGEAESGVPAGGYRCTVTLKVKNFEPAVSRASSAASSSSGAEGWAE